jgi:hypothetical protein
MSRCEWRDAPLVGPHVDASGDPRLGSTYAGRCDCPSAHQETGRGQRPARRCQELEGLAKVGTRQPAHASPRGQHRGGVLRARPAEGKAISAFRVRGAAARPPRAAGTVVALSRAAEGSLPGRGRRPPAPVVTRPAAALSPRSGSPRLPLGRCASLLCAQSNASDSIAPCVRTLSGVSHTQNRGSHGRFIPRPTACRAHGSLQRNGAAEPRSLVTSDVQRVVQAVSSTPAPAPSSTCQSQPLQRP